MDENNNVQKDLLELNMLNRQLKQIEEQARIAEQQIYEHEMMELSLEEIQTKKNSEIMIQLGPGLFIPGKIGDEEKVMIHLGNKILAKKKYGEAIEIIKKRKDKRILIGEKLGLEMQKILERMTILEGKMRHEEEHNHPHGH